MPARESGYCVDDNARALMVALHAEALSGSADTKRLVSTYLAFLHAAQTPEGRFRNFMTYDRVVHGHGRRHGVRGLHGPRAVGAGHDRSPLA